MKLGTQFIMQEYKSEPNQSQRPTSTETKMKTANMHTVKASQEKPVTLIQFNIGNALQSRASQDGKKTNSEKRELESNAVTSGRTSGRPSTAQTKQANTPNVGPEFKGLQQLQKA